METLLKLFMVSVLSSYAGLYYFFAGKSSAPFNPSQLSGLTLWLDANNSGSITQSAGKVSQWNDLSATAATFTQATANMQPAYVASAIGGKPAISPFGSSSTLGCLVDTGTNAFVGNGSTAFTLWVVAQGRSFSFPVIATFHAGAGTDNPQMSFSSSAGYSNLFFGADPNGAFGSVRAGSAFASFATTPYIASITYNGGGLGVGNYAIYQSNVSEAVSFANSGAQAVANTVIGANDAAGNDPILYIAEIAIYNRVLNSTELGQLQTYGHAKYGL